MVAVATNRSASRKRTIAYAIGAAALVLFLVAGMAFAYSISVTRVTNNARSLHWTNATIGTSALIRAGLAQAITFAELLNADAVGPDEVEFAMEQVEISELELQSLLEIGETHDSTPLLARFISRIRLAIEDLESGNVATARDRVRTQVEPAYVDLVDSLRGEQRSIQADIEANSAAGRTLNGWVVFALTLGVPGSAVAAYWAVTRRQVRALKERNRLELEAERTINRAKDAFIAGLSHELRTPLTSIYGFAEILADGSVQGSEATRETGEIIANEAAEMTRMVDDLLVASRLGSIGVEIEIRATNLQDVVDAALTVFEQAGFTVTEEETVTLVAADPARLRHVLVNLLSNAVRHGGPDKGIDLTEGMETVEVDVWDTGPGVPEDQIDRLFARFIHSGKTPLLTGSVGLGLAVADRLTALMGGSLQYRRFGGRTHFTVTLPLAASIPDEQDDAPSVAPEFRSVSA